MLLASPALHLKAEREDVKCEEEDARATKLRIATSKLKKTLPVPLRGVQTIYTTLNDIKRTEMMALMDWLKDAVHEILISLFVFR